MKKINREKFAPWRTVVGQPNLGRPPKQGGGVPVPPSGFVFLTDPDGAYLVDPDGYYLVEAA